MTKKGPIKKENENPAARAAGNGVPVLKFYYHTPATAVPVLKWYYQRKKIQPAAGDVCSSTKY